MTTGRLSNAVRAGLPLALQLVARKRGRPVNADMLQELAGFRSWLEEPLFVPYNVALYGWHRDCDIPEDRHVRSATRHELHRHVAKWAYFNIAGYVVGVLLNGYQTRSNTRWTADPDVSSIVPAMPASGRRGFVETSVAIGLPTAVRLATDVFFTAEDAPHLSDYLVTLRLLESWHEDEPVDITDWGNHGEQPHVHVCRIVHYRISGLALSVRVCGTQTRIPVRWMQAETAVLEHS